MSESIKRVCLTVNGKQRRFIISDDEGCVLPSETLLDTLRERLGLTAAKRSCEHGACGFCTPGIIMSTQALLLKNPSPTEEELTEALSGNYCRCISHYQVIRTVMGLIDQMKGGERECLKRWKKT